MKYITGKDFNLKGIEGKFHLPVNTELERIDNTLYFGNHPICYATSNYAKEYFARNDDDNGIERFNLSHQILHRLQVLKVAYNKAIEEVENTFTETTTEEERINALAEVEDYLDVAYKRIKVALPNCLNDYNCFNSVFYDADIDKLEIVLNIVNGIREDFTETMYEEYLEEISQR